APPPPSPVINPVPEPDPLLWPEPQRAFYQDGPGLLLTEEQRAEFLTSDEDGRDAFIRKFLSDPDRSTPDNELRQAIERRQRLAAREYPSPLDPRAQLLFLNGPPDARKVFDCGATFRPMEIWTYGQPPTDHSLILYRPASGEPFQLWLAIDSKRALYAPEMEAALDDLARSGDQNVRIDRRFCPDSEEVDRVTGIDGLTPRSRQNEELARVSIGGDEDNPRRVFRWITPQNRVWSLERPRDLAAWIEQAGASDPASEEPQLLEAGKIDVDFPRRQEQRMAIRALLPVAGDSLRVATDGSKPEVRLTVSVMIEHAGKVFEELRVRYHLPPPPKGESVPLLIERQLRPEQTFLLRLKVRDDVSGAEAWVARGFAVPSQPVVRLGEVARTAPRGEILLPSDLAGKDRLMLPPPPDEVVLSVWRADPLIDGERIVKVVFLVDGKEQVSRTRPPFSAEVRLATFPKEQTVRVEGFDQNNELVAFDEVTLNRARGAFRVKIVEPKADAKTTGPLRTVRARATVATPDDRRVESVEWRLNDAPVATLTSPPWETTVQVPASEAIVYLTVIATLDDGSRAEETHFLRAPENFEQVEVHLVELYTAVTESSGRPVQGLTADDFEVLEGGKRQTISKFERVQNLPLNVGLVLDASTSMASSLSEAQRAAAGFLQNLVTPRDRCFAMGFSTRPYLLMAPVNDAEAVGRSLEGIQAIGSTALYDAVVTSLYYFRGFQGQRAMILLSDGDDTSSHTPFERVLEFAQRSGVAIYPIGLGIGALHMEARNKLSQLAEATGGQTFFVDRADQLAQVYDQIEEELRGRYLLAYQTERDEEAGFRPVDVRVKKRGLKARTMRGYYP
ncbi:MAG TPA: VWA domain-containing protein, partial [Thermoanaerobaculia bacterium]|nr:VWA domain-containing protein [Thermoanaerobaculia bacterium]